jgi:hypothetical protein
VPRQTLCLLLVLGSSLLAAAAHAARVLPQPVVESPGEVAGSVAPEPVKPRARPTRRLVYSCTTPSLVTFADRPCGEQPVVRELVVLPATLPLESPPTIGVAPQADRNRHGQPDLRTQDDKHAEACRRLEARLEHIDSQMRAGYGAGEAGRLWDRWREAKSSLREARC